MRKPSWARERWKRTGAERAALAARGLMLTLFLVSTVGLSGAACAGVAEIDTKASIAATTTATVKPSVAGSSTTEPDWNTTPSSGHHPDTTAASDAPSTTFTSEGDKVALFPVQVGDEWGFIDRSGAWVIEPRFPGPTPPVFVGGLAIVETQAADGTGRCGFIDTTGAWVIQPTFEQVRPFADGVAPAAIRTPENRMFWGYIDRTGAWVIQPRFADAWGFAFGLAPVQAHAEVEDSDKWGYIDKTGAWVFSQPWEPPEVGGIK